MMMIVMITISIPFGELAQTAWGPSVGLLALHNIPSLKRKKFSSLVVQSSGQDPDWLVCTKFCPLLAV